MSENPLPEESPRRSRNSRYARGAAALFPSDTDSDLTKNIKVRSSKVEAEEYLQKHKIADVLSILTSSLVYTRPFNSRRHMSGFLKELKQVRDAYSGDRDKLVPHGPKHPLFQEKTLITLFKAADTLDKGHISVETATQLAAAVGADNPDTLFENCSEIVAKYFFSQSLHEALLRKTAAFHDVKARYRANY